MWRLLGPVEVTIDGRRAAVERPRHRAVLGYLLLNANLVVSQEHLIDALWGTRPPASAVTQVHAAVSHLRKALRAVSAAGLPTRSGPGYRLDVADAEFDLATFTGLVGQARAATVDRRLEQASRLYRSALDLWRGSPLTGAVGSYVEAAAAALQERRLNAYEDVVDVELVLSREAALIGELRAMVSAHPLRERLVGQLMTALHRSGRQAEALEVFRRLREALRDEHGLDPGPALIAVHEAVVRSDAAVGRGAGPQAAVAVAVAHQLPAPIRGFVGRARELALLDRALVADDSTAAVVAIAGMAGVGKTALALQWAHAVADRFPDGELYIDLRGYSAGEPVPPVAAIAQWLRALGVQATEVPLELDEAAALLRTRLRGRRMMLVLDNARDADQVRPLLPGAAGCLALVTSRDRLTGLVAVQQAHRVTVDVLDQEDSIALLGQLIGTGGVAVEPSAVAAVAAACGNLPLALRIAGANLVDQPDDLTAYAAALACEQQLTRLDVAGDPATSVRAAFALSYRQLPPHAARAFRLVAEGPGSDIAVRTAAALLDEPVDRTRAALDLLAAAHLVVEHRPGRYRYHDLLRQFASAQEPDGGGAADERTRARTSLYAYYLDALASAAPLLFPQTVRIPADVPQPGPGDDGFVDPSVALSWLDDELPNLVAAVTAAADAAMPQSWLLADGLRGYFWLRRCMPEWIGTATAGLTAARERDEGYALAAMHLSLGLAHRVRADYPTATAHFVWARSAARRVGWPEAEASCLSSLGVIHAELGETRAALSCIGAAIDIYRRIGRRAGEAVALANMSTLRAALGDIRRSTEDSRAAFALYRTTGNLAGEAMTLANIGINEGYLGRSRLGAAHLHRALRLQERIRDRYGQVVTLAGLAELDRCAGRLDSALKGASAAIDIARDIDEVSNLVAACNVRAAVLRSRGRTAEALAACREGLTRARASGNDFAQVEALTATALCETGRSMMDIPGAVRTARQAVVLARRAGYHLLEGKALTALAELHLAADRPALARRFAQRAVAHHRHNGYRPGQIQALALLAFAEPDLKAANAHVDAARALARAGGLVVLPEWGDWNA